MSEATKTRTNAFVATVLDGGLRVAINKGRNAGIEVGDQFLVVHEGPEILDPKTHESLGKIELVRGRGKIIQVEEKFSVLKNLGRRSRHSALAAQFGIGQAIESPVRPRSAFETEQKPFDKVAIEDLAKPV